MAHYTFLLIIIKLIPKTCLGSGSLPSKPDLCVRAPTGVGPTNEHGRRGLRKRRLPKRPQCSTVPIPSPCDRTLGPRTPDRHLTESTIPLWSAYLSGASILIRAIDTPILELHIARSISNNDCWLAIGLHQDGVLKTVPVNSYTRTQEVVARLLQG